MPQRSGPGEETLTGERLARELDWQRAHVPPRFREYVSRGGC